MRFGGGAAAGNWAEAAVSAGGGTEGEGVGEVLLEVRASNQRALDFYRSLGWEETGRRPRYYADPEEDAVLMGLKLE